MRLPRVFVGSSTENLEIASAVQTALDKYAEVTVWDQGIFRAGLFTLESLENALENFDAAVFVFAGEDEATVRDSLQRTPRDNVVFELGLFVGRIGRQRSFILKPRGDSRMRILSDLLGLTVLEYQEDRKDGNFDAAVAPACRKIRLVLGDNALPQRASRPTLELVSRRAFSEELLRKLADEKVHQLRLITYTGEVDAGLWDKFHVVGQKNVEVYKRSILTDLAESQEWNLRRIAEGALTAPWNKRTKSIEASRRLSAELPDGVNVEQFLYVAPPTRRAYIFDDAEAVFAWYHVADAAEERAGSVYRGMTGKPAVKARRGTPDGDLFLDELRDLAMALRRCSRTWEQERGILLQRKSWAGPGPRPCISPRAVLLDVDGVLLDSLHQYVTAWREAFKPLGKDFPEERVYLEEGRRDTETIIRFLEDQRLTYDEATVAQINERRRKILREMAWPAAMDGANELLEAVQASGAQIWLVTGSTKPGLPAYLESLFPRHIARDAVVTGEDVAAGKPSPEPYLLACRRARVLPHEAVAVENAPLGIQSANQAGTFCIAVSTGPLKSAILEEAGARVVFSSVRDPRRQLPLCTDDN